MWKLVRPAHTARDTFLTCISKVRNRALKARLVGITQAIVDASAEFDAAASRTELHLIAQQTLVGGNVSRKEMEAVYTSRMAKKEAPGRDIYDDLISAPAQGRCPLCGQRQVSTLDHHLPKAYYPALAVAPLNLVPSCGDCNKAKLHSIPRQAFEETLHPYFDDIDQHRWLRAEILQTRPASLRFFVDPPTTWNAVLASRVSNHFRTLGLARLYTAGAAEELLSIRFQLSRLYAVGGSPQVLAQLQECAASCLAARRNGWRAAAYEACAASAWFCNGGFAVKG